MSRRPVRILQTSDVHLGPRSFEPRGRLHDYECVCPLDVMAHLVDEHRVDVLLIVGDLFEHARVSDAHVETVFARLGAVSAEVALLPGNHDVYDETALLRRHRAAADEAGVRFFDELDGSAHDFADGALRIWARAMNDHSQSYLPLAGAPVHPGDRWFVAAAHGHFVESLRDDAHRSSRILPDDIDAIGADYVALGHWHVTTDLAKHGVQTPAWYSGAPLFGYGAGRMLLVDLIADSAPMVTPLDVLDHPAAGCTERTERV